MKLLTLCWRNNWIRRPLYAVFGLALLFGGWCTWVNWNGARHLRKVEAMLRAEGETLDFNALKQNRIPDDQNYCAIPILKALAVAVYGDSNVVSLRITPKRFINFRLPIQRERVPRLKSTRFQLGLALDLDAWVQWLRSEASFPMPVNSGDSARDLLTAFSKHEPLLDDLAIGLEKPYSRWIVPQQEHFVLPPEYPYDWKISRSLRAIALHVVACVRATDASKAHKSALIHARLTEACIHDPMMDAYTVHLFAENLSGVVWEMCNAHSGTTDDFMRLEASLAKIDTRRAYLDSVRFHLARQVSHFQLIKEERRKGIGIFEKNPFKRLPVSVDFAVKHAPDGVYDEHCAQIAESNFRYGIQLLKTKAWKGALKQIEEHRIKIAKPKLMAQAMRTLKVVLPSGLANTLPDMNTDNPYDFYHFTPYAKSQTTTDQSIIACALERYRLVHGDYPELLEHVKRADGNPLPLDVMSEEPMKYEKIATNHYKLWSVGVDGRDDGGQRAGWSRWVDDLSWEISAH